MTREAIPVSWTIFWRVVLRIVLTTEVGCLLALMFGAMRYDNLAAVCLFGTLAGIVALLVNYEVKRWRSR